MKIAIVYHYFAHYRSPVLDALKTIDRSRYEFVADSKGVASRGIKLCDNLKPFSEAKCYFFPCGFMLQTGLLKHCFRKDLDAIVFLGDWKWPSTWLAAALARINGKRVLFWTHGWRVPDRGAIRIIRKAFYRIAQGLLLYGFNAREIGIEEGFCSRQLHVVFNSIDLGENGRLAAQQTGSRSVSSKKLRIICSARLLPSRRLDLLIEAMRLLNEQSYSISAVIVGDGPVREELEKRSVSAGLDVEFVGECYDKKRIASLMEVADVTVCPGALGLTAIQSMFFGLPVITTDDFAVHGPEVETVVEGLTGKFFSDGSAESLANAIGWFLSRTAGERNNMSGHCSRLVRTLYTPDHQAHLIDAAVWGERPTEVSVKKFLDV